MRDEEPWLWGGSGPGDAFAGPSKAPSSASLSTDSSTMGDRGLKKGSGPRVVDAIAAPPATAPLPLAAAGASGPAGRRGSWTGDDAGAIGGDGALSVAESSAPSSPTPSSSTPAPTGAGGAGGSAVGHCWPVGVAGIAASGGEGHSVKLGTDEIRLVAALRGVLVRGLRRPTVEGRGVERVLGSTQGSAGGTSRCTVRRWRKMRVRHLAPRRV